MYAMRLDALIDCLQLDLQQGDPATPIQELTDDSRDVHPGVLFIARDPKYIPAALEAGAAAILSAESPESLASPDLPWVHAASVDQPLAGRIAERFFDQPAARLKLIAVTGTNGKTTTAFIIQHLLRAAGHTTGLIGTVVVDDGRTRRPAELTTPGAIQLSRLLSQMVAAGCTAAVLEASSHALAQGRTAALDISAAVFTNLTGDHLDYHADVDDYLAAKKILFDQLTTSAVAVTNADDPFGSRITADCRARVITCSTKDAPADGRATVDSLAADATRARFTGSWGDADVTLPLPGNHNVMNALQALAASHAVFNTINPADLATTPGVPGRLERVTSPDADEAPTVLVDYAHTHDALDNVLRALRPITRGKLRVLFGCGGDRDKTKRPKMAAVACALADDVMITSDNPRTEDPDAIIRDILTGVPADMTAYAVEPDRAKAIAAIINVAAPDDVVLLAGKGHEDYQIIGTTKRHFDDREQAAAALAARWGSPLKRI